MNTEDRGPYPPAVETPPEENAAADNAPPGTVPVGATPVETAPLEVFPPEAMPVEAPPATVGIIKPLVACVAAALVPGLGHAVLRKWDRALVFLGSISIMFALGLQLNGRLFSPDFSDLFAILKFIADAGTGSFYWLSWLRGMGIGDPAVYTYDFGNVFIYTAGLLNMLVIVDAFDIAMGRKP